MNERKILVRRGRGDDPVAGDHARDVARVDEDFAAEERAVKFQQPRMVGKPVHGLKFLRIIVGGDAHPDVTAHAFVGHKVQRIEINPASEGVLPGFTPVVPLNHTEHFGPERKHLAARQEPLEIQKPILISAGLQGRRIAEQWRGINKRNFALERN